MESHGVRDLVVSCIDYRFRRLIVEWIWQSLADQADLVAVAGGVKSFIDDASREYALSHLEIARKLHGVRTIHLLNHLDCGAYGGSGRHHNEDCERQFHFDQCTVAQRIILDRFPNLQVKLYFVNFSGVLPAEDQSAVPLAPHHLRELAQV